MDKEKYGMDRREANKIIEIMRKKKVDRLQFCVNYLTIIAEKNNNVLEFETDDLKATFKIEEK